MENIKTKIKKLLDLSEGAKEIGSLEEAANAAEKAQGLLMKHNLSMAEIKDIEISDIGHAQIMGGDFNFEKREGLWTPTLMGNLCEHNLCRTLISKAGSQISKLTVIGEEQNVSMVMDMFISLVALARHLERTHWSKYQGLEKRGKFRRGFLMGFSIGIGDQLRNSLARLKAQSEGVTALVHVSSEAVNNYVNNNFALSRKRIRSGGTSSNDGLSRGFAEGKKSNVNFQKHLG